MTIDLVPHLPQLRRYALKLDRDLADDLVQSTCYHALRYQHQYDPALSKESNWLARILKHQYFTWLKLRKMSGTGGRRHAEQIREVQLPRTDFSEEEHPPMPQPPALQTQPEGPARVLAAQIAAWIEHKRNLTAGQRQTLVTEIGNAGLRTWGNERTRSQDTLLCEARRRLREAMDL